MRKLCLSTKFHIMKSGEITVFYVVLRLGLNHLREHKFRHNFADTLNPLWPCSIELETKAHFFLRCHFYNVIRANLVSDFLNIDSSVPTENDEKLLDILLYGNSKFNTTTNQNILIWNLLKTLTDLTTRFSKYLYSSRTIGSLLHGLYMTRYYFFVEVVNIFSIYHYILVYFNLLLSDQ